MTLSTEKIRRVLVVVHDIASLTSIQNKCTQRHYEVVTCSTASLGMNLLKEANDLFHIVLLDAQMPDLNSYDFVKYAKHQLQIKIPIVLMSDDDSESAMIKAYQNGADDIWGKPLDEKCINQMWSLVIKKQVENEEKQVQKIRGRDNIENAPIVTNGCVVEKAKNGRIKWTDELDELFEKAMHHLGPKGTQPKKILKQMNVSGLEPSHVSSHLQKWKSKRSSEGTPINNKRPRVGRKISKLNEGQEVHHSIMLEERNDIQDTNTVGVTNKCIRFLNLSQSAEPQLGLEVTHPNVAQNLVNNSAMQCDNNPKGNNDNEDTNTATMFNLLPQSAQLNHEAVHPMPEQHHKVTWDSANQCDNNSLATEQNGHQLDLSLSQSAETQLGLEVSHPNIPEQNHNVTFDSAHQCDNNTLATEQNSHRLDLSLSSSSSNWFEHDYRGYFVMDATIQHL